MNAIDALPPDLQLALDGLYREAGVVTTDAPRREPESDEYGACRLGLDGRCAVYRVARTTPTKAGQFVTVWKRAAPGAAIAPFDSIDDIDLVIIGVSGTGEASQHQGQHRGQFVFDRQALLRHGVMSQDGVGGKRALRVYPPWSRPLAQAAIRSQQWQLRYFVPLAPSDAGAPARLRRLLHA